MDSEIDLLEKERDLILNTSTQLSQKVEQLTLQAREDRQRLTCLEDLRVARDKEYSALQSRHREVLKLVEQLTRDRELLQEKVTYLEAQVAKLDSEKIKLQTDHVSGLFKLREDVLRLTQEKTHLETLVEGQQRLAQTELHSFAEQLQLQKAETQTVHAQFEEQRKDLARSQAKVAQLAEELRGALSDNKFLLEQKAELDQALATQQRQWEEKWQQAEERHANQLDIASKVFELSNGSSGEDRLAAVVEKLQRSQQRQRESASQVHSLQQQLSAYLAEYEAKAPVLAQQKAEQEDLVLALSKATWELTEQKAQLAAAQAELRSQAKAAAQHDQVIQAWEQTTKLLEAQVKALHHENYVLKNKSEPDANSLSFQDLDDLHRKHLELQAAFETYKAAKAEELQNAEEEHFAQVAAVKTELRTLENEYASLSLKFEQAVHATQPLSFDRLQALEAFYQEQTQQHNQLLTERNQAVSNADDVQREHRRLSQRFDRQQAALATAQQECSRLKEAQETAAHTAQAATERLAEYEAKVQLREEQNSRLTALLEQAHDAHRRLTAQFNQLQAGYAQLVEDLQNVDCTMVEMQQRHAVETEELVKAKTQCYAELSQIKREHATSKQEWAEELAKLSTQLENYRILAPSRPSCESDLQRLKKEVFEQQEKNKLLAAQLQELAQYETDHSQLQALKTQLDEKSAECEDYKRLADHYKLSIEILKKDIQSIRHAHFQLEERVLRDRRQFSHSHQQFSELYMQNELLSQEKSQLENTVAALRSETTRLHTELQRSQNDSDVEDFKHLRSRNQQLQGHIQQLRTQLKKVNAEHKHCEPRLRDSQEQSQAQRTQLEADLEQRLAQLRSEHSAELATQKTKLEKRVDHFKRQGEMLRDAIRSGKSNSPEVLSQLVSLVHKALNQ